MSIRIVNKPKVPTLSPVDAFLAQRKLESGSTRLRNAVMALLVSGKAHTATVAKVFDLVLRDSEDRITEADVERVLPGFTVEKSGW